MVDHRITYNEQARQYDDLVRREDYQHNLLPAIQRWVNLEGKIAADLGAGTGRVSELIAPFVRQLYSFDLSMAMLKIAAKRLDHYPQCRPSLMIADHRYLPLADASIDLLIAGWSLCYLVDWHPQTWRQELGKGMSEISRVVRQGGHIVIIETQGTGCERPDPPAHLKEYFSFLDEKEFEKNWIRTDYRFSSLQEAMETSRFFFGDELARQVSERQWRILPECTGLWHKTVS